MSHTITSKIIRHKETNRAPVTQFSSVPPKKSEKSIAKYTYLFFKAYVVNLVNQWTDRKFYYVGAEQAEKESNN